jgi:periplasmic protein TonB
LPGSDRTIRRPGALAASLLLHAAALAGLVAFMQRIIPPPASQEVSVAMLFEPVQPEVVASPARDVIAEPPVTEQAPPSEPPPEPAAADAGAPAPAQAQPEPPAEPVEPQPVEPQIALPEPKADRAPAPTPLAPPATRPPARRVATVRPPAQQDTRPSTAPVATPAAASIAPLLPAHPVAGMESDRPPAYPESARRRGQQGRVLLRVNVSADGLPLTISVAQSSGFASLDSAAVAAVQKWRFVPASRGGVPEPAVAEWQVRFRLTDEPQ